MADHCRTWLGARAELAAHWRTVHAAETAGGAPTASLQAVVDAAIERAARALEAGPGDDPPRCEPPAGAVSQRIARDVRELGRLEHALARLASERGCVADCETFARVREALGAHAAELVDRACKDREGELRRRRAERLARVVHELKQPLTSLAVTAAAIQRHGSAGPAAAAIIERSVRRLASIAARLRDLELVDGPDRPVRPVTIGARELLVRVARQVEPLAQQKGLPVVVRCDPALRLRADPDLLEDALLNLAGNAVKYTAAGEVALEGEELGHGVAVRLAVRDTGPGIDPAQHVAIFRPFVRLGSDGEGLGLGLSIALNAVEAQGGELRVESAPGAGACFQIVLPRGPPG